MNKIFCATVLYALGFTICIFACPDPAFYRPHRGYMQNCYDIKVEDGKIYVRDPLGWFNVEYIGMDLNGAYYLTRLG